MKEINTIRLLGISGSLRAASIHSGLLRAFRELLPEGVEMEIANLQDIPLYNAELDGETQPEGVARLKQQIRAADLLVIASPEYNGSFSGVLKNAIDWATRPVSEAVQSGKLAVVMTSAGRSGGVKGMIMLRMLLGSINVNVMLRPEFALSLARQKFDAESGDLMDGEVRKELANFVEKSLEWLARQTAWQTEE